MVTDSLSHDLRTPLARLRNTLETALAQPADADSTDRIAEALSEADYVHQVFSDLLDIARVDANLAQSQIEPLDLSKTVNDAIELYRPLAEDKNQTLRADITPRVMIEGHEQFLARAVSNLLDNAIKFTPEGGIITVSVSPQDNIARLTIADTGPGISASDWPKALQRMGRLEPQRTSPGAGLGLSLVAKVAALHGTDLVRVETGTGLTIRGRVR
ncbi:sensor histidine kinase [Profundibacter sp.]